MLIDTERERDADMVLYRSAMRGVTQDLVAWHDPVAAYRSCIYAARQAWTAGYAEYARAALCLAHAIQTTPFIPCTYLADRDDYHDAVIRQRYALYPR